MASATSGAASSGSTQLVRVDFERGWNRVGDRADAILRRDTYRWHAYIKRTGGGDYVLTGTRWDAFEPQSSIEATLGSFTVLTGWFERRNAAVAELADHLGPDRWRAGSSTSDATWAALAHMYQTLVAEGTPDVVEVLVDLMQAPSRDSVATRLRRVRVKGFLTSSRQGVVAGAATDRAQLALPWSWTWPQG